MNWPFLTLTALPVLARGQEQVGLPGQERRDLQQVAHLAGGLGLAAFVDVGRHRQAGALLDGVERLAALRPGRGRGTTCPRCGWPCRTTP